MYTAPVLILEDQDVTKHSYGIILPNVQYIKDIQQANMVIYKNKILKNRWGKRGNIHSFRHLKP
jgi:hypothetical protein